MAGFERELHRRREDSEPRSVRPVGPSRSPSPKAVSERFISRASACKVASSSPSGSVKTARALPARGLSVKTSQSS